MPAGTLNLTIEQGATFRKLLTWKTGTPPTPVDLTGYAARMQMRNSPTAPTAVVSITNTPNSQGVITLGGLTGTIEIYINDTATMSITSGGVYDLELIAPNTDVIRLVQGKYTISPNITK